MTTLVVHGGAWNAEEESVKRLESEATKQACKAASAQKDLLSIVETAVNVLEDAPMLDAGTGSIIQMDGRIRMDAAIADSSGHYSAILQIEQVKHPVSVARKLLEQGYHNILSGQGALLFALENGFKMESTYTEHRLEMFMKQRRELPILSYANLVKNKKALNAKKLSTVGAVAVDAKGNLISAASTGGLYYGYPGRVGDTPLYGHGMYCSKHVAVACTGHGELIMKIMMAKQVELYFLESKDLQSACERAIADLGKVGGQGGLIAVSRDKQVGIAHNTKFMGTSTLKF